jgi:predicted ATPase
MPLPHGHAAQYTERKRVPTTTAFGDLLKLYRRRRPGLTQERLAHMIGYDEAVLARMVRGKKDLTGPSGRDRVVLLIDALNTEGVLSLLDEANALLDAAGMPPLYAGLPLERRLIARLGLPDRAPDPARRDDLPALPQPPSSLVGRDHDVADIATRLRTARLVTLTGAGGCGKTRLALAVAHAVLPAYLDGALFVGLAKLREAAQVDVAIAQSLRLDVTPGLAALDSVIQRLAHRQMLLVLDNFEHVLEAAPIVSRLLMACHNVTVLATSREILHVSGEHEYSVEPLPVPRADQTALADLLAVPSVQLFVERARAVQKTFELTPGTSDSVGAICRRLDGLPLAIELAAGRVRDMPVTSLAARLTAPEWHTPARPSSPLSLLTGGPRDVEARQRTLRDTIEWSYRLLDPLQQRLLRSLGVFVGGAEIEQLAAVCDGASEFVESALTALLRSNLVRAERSTDGRQRYHLLELVREYALERLTDAGELLAACRAHALAFASLGEHASWPMRGHEQPWWVARLDQDYSNFQAALTWSFGSTGDPSLGCRLVAGWIYYWYVVSTHFAECLTWLRRALAVPVENLPPLIRADLLICACLNDQQDDMIGGWSAEALALYRGCGNERGVALANMFAAAACLTAPDRENEMHAHIEAFEIIATRLDDHWLLGLTWLVRAWAADNRGDDYEAERCYRVMLAERTASGNLADIAIGQRQLASLLLKVGRFQEASALLHESLAICRAQGNVLDEVVALQMIGECLRWTGRLDEAIAILSECIALARVRLPGDRRIYPLILLGKARAEQGDADGARTALREAALIRPSVSLSRDPTADLLAAFAMQAFASGDMARCVRLWGAAEAHWRPMNAATPITHVWATPACVGLARVELGAAAYEAAYASSRALTLADVLAE